LKRIEQISKFQGFIKETLAKHNYNSGDLTLLTGDFNVDGRSKRQYNNADITPLAKLDVNFYFLLKRKANFSL